MIQLEGRNPVYEALRLGTITYIKLEYGHEKDVKIKQIIDLARKKGIRVDIVKRRHMDRLSTTGKHQGIIAFAQTNINWSLGKVLQETSNDVCILVLDHIQDPYNLGAIIRTCECAGIDGIIIPKKGSTRVNNTVHRVSMGGSIYVPVWQTNIYPAIKRMQNEGLKIVGIDSDGDKPYFEEDLRGAVTFVLGGEDRGINPTLLSKCDSVVRIPLRGKLESLNVSVATSIVLFERVRQQETD